jgi:predicted RNA-binding Zn ribbon-like protein
VGRKERPAPGRATRTGLSRKRLPVDAAFLSARRQGVKAASGVTYYNGYMPPSPGVLLEPPSGGSFSFDPGASCLKFALSGGEGSRSAYERLHSASDLRVWLKESLDVTVDEIGGRDLRDARVIRGAIWSLADATIADRSLPRAAVNTINRWAARAPMSPQIGPRRTREWARPTTVRQVLGTVARDAVELFTSSKTTRLRRCAGSGCQLIFVDTSRPGRRRWCSMNRCGNRSKVIAFRERHREEEAR